MVIVEGDVVYNISVFVCVANGDRRKVKGQAFVQDQGL